MINLSRDNRGQSFVEAMVALTIIVTSVSSALVLVQSSITASRIGGSQIVAANLAREGVEVVRSIRDGNWLAGRGFDVGLTDAGVKAARPMFDKIAATWALEFPATTPLMADAFTQLYLGSDGTYLHAASLPSGASVASYRRLLTIDLICRNDTTGAERIESGPALPCGAGTETRVGLAVRSRVQWVGLSGNPRDTVLEERLYDWR